MVNFWLWFLVGYLGVSAWCSTAVLLKDGEATRGSDLKAALLAVLVIWAVPAIFVRELLKGDDGNGRK